MPIDSTPSTVATNALQAIPFAGLIGGPLDACIKAQAMAAKTSWEFIRNVGLTKDPNTLETKAINVTFQYQKNGEMVNLVVPLLTIVPIPYISINDVTIDFKANLSASSSSVQEESKHEDIGGEASAHLSLGWGPFSISADMKANYSSKKDSKSSQESKYSVEYTMDVHVGAGQSSMPAGLAAILNILQSSITEAKTSGELALSPPSTTFDGSNKGAKVLFEARGKNNTGLIQKNLKINYKFEPPAGITLNYAVLKGTGTIANGTGDITSDDSGTALVQVSLDSATNTAIAVVPVTITATITDDDQKTTVKTTKAAITITPAAAPPSPPAPKP